MIRISYLLLMLLFGFQLNGQNYYYLPPFDVVPLTVRGLIVDNTSKELSKDASIVDLEDLKTQFKQRYNAVFLYDDVLNVDLITYEDSIKNNVKILYRLDNNQIYALSNQGQVIPLNLNYYKGFNNNGKEGVEQFRRVNIAEPNVLSKILFYNDDFTWSCKYSLIRNKNETYIPSISYDPNKQLIRKEYYLSMNDELIKIRLTNEALINILPEKYRTKLNQSRKVLKLRKINRESQYLKFFNAFFN